MSRTVAEGIRDFEYGAPGTYRWLACEQCGLIALDPLPTDEVLRLAYPPDYHAYIPQNSKITRCLISHSRAKLARSIASRLPSSGAVLDIGCSRGDLLAEIGRLGTFRLFGVEYDARMASEARAKGIDAFVGDFDNAPFKEGMFDFVLMQHVIEHVPDPIKTLKRVRSSLRPGGVVVGELPNIRSWDALLFRRYWGGGHAPRHLWHFTPETLRRSLEQCGFTEIKVTPALHTGHWAMSLQTWLRGGRTDLNGLRSGRAWYYPLFLLLSVPINAAQMLLHRTGIMRFEARRAA